MATAWLAAIVRQSATAATAVAPGRIRRDGPELFRFILAAIASDAGLARLESGGDLESVVAGVGQLVAAHDPASAEIVLRALDVVLRDAVAGEAPGLPEDVTRHERFDVVTSLIRAQVLQPGAATVWPGTLERAISTVRTMGAPLSVLSVELVDGHLIEHADRGAGTGDQLADFRQAVSEVADHECTLISDRAFRVWLVATGYERSGAVMLAHAAARAVRGLSAWRRAPLAACVGVATLDEDGNSAADLIQAAEGACLAAAAAGQDVCARR